MSDWAQGATSLGDVVTSIQGIARQLSSIIKSKGITGSFTMDASSSTVVSQSSIKDSSQISLTATNADAATLVGSPASPYISAISAGASFTVSTADGSSASGTETFSYRVIS